jgi:curved DNA-binding protein CbpA
MNYFDNCKTVEEVKTTYRDLAKAHHPDKGGDAKLFIEIQRQYDVWRPYEDKEKDRDEHDKYYQGFAYKKQQQTFYGHMGNRPIDNTRGRWTQPDPQFHVDVMQLKIQISLLQNANQELNKILKNTREAYDLICKDLSRHKELHFKYQKESKHYKDLWDAEYKARCDRDMQLHHMASQIEYLQDQLKNSLYRPWYIKLKELVYDKK